MRSLKWNEYIQPRVKKTFEVNSPWFAGRSILLAYSIEELLATKLRALYQRKKGGDLYDFWYVAHQVSGLDIQTIIDIFQHYMKEENV